MCRDLFESVERGAAKRTAKDLMTYARELEYGLMEYLSVPFTAPNLLRAIYAMELVTFPTGDVGVVERVCRHTHLAAVWHVTEAWREFTWRGSGENLILEFHCTVVVAVLL